MRNAIAAGLFLWLTPVLAVAVGGFGVTVIPALLLAGAGAAAVAYLSSPV
jgi:hypothetical protein